MSIELYPFRFRDPVTGRWMRARYKATIADIARAYAEWEITGPAEVRTPIGAHFSPYKLMPHAELKRLEEPAPVLNPHLRRPPEIDRFERFLGLLFLRRYVTYCARRYQYAQMQGAVALHREIATLDV
jgi:hypothetical protein